MANWTDTTKIDRLWKQSFNKARGDSTAQFYEEGIPTAYDVQASEVYADSIPYDPPAATTSVVKVWTAAGDGSIALTRDRKYNGGRVWVAKPTFQSNFSSGSGTVTDIMKNFISPKYGPRYVVKVYDKTGTVIPELSDVSWLFDYKAGVLTFETDRTEGGTSVSDCIKIEVYQYVGKFVSTNFDDLAEHVAQTQDVHGSTTLNLPNTIVQRDGTGNFSAGIITANLNGNATTADVAIKAQTYVWHQDVPDSVWTVTHNLGKFPSVSVVDSAGTVVIGDVTYVDNNQLVITFIGSFSGVAYLN